MPIDVVAKNAVVQIFTAWVFIFGALCSWNSPVLKLKAKCMLHEEQQSFFCFCFFKEDNKDGNQEIVPYSQEQIVTHLIYFRRLFGSPTATVHFRLAK